MSKRSPAARIMAYCKTAPIDELRVVLEMAREEYRARVESEAKTNHTQPAPRLGRPRKARKQREAAAPSLLLENEAATS